MNTTSYTQHPEVRAILAELRLERTQHPAPRPVSPIRDAAGNQYVDLVMEGGGTLGVALLGYLYVLEQMNIRFLEIAGTSAGSIVAMLLAALGPIDQPKTEWLIEKVAGKDFYDFVDGDQEVRKFVDALLNPDMRKGKKARLTTRVLDDLKQFYGLNPGKHFHDWMTGLLQECGVASLADLRKVRSTPPEGINCPPERWQRISVVTADVTTGTKVALPDAAPLFWENPENANPADFVRASMSVPVFFYPFSIQNIPQAGESRSNWARLANYHGPIPPEVLFVDGGAMSNFPVSLLFSPDKHGDAPLFGVKIGKDRSSFTSCDSFGAFAGAMLGSLMAFYDNDFLVQHPELQKQTGVIDSGSYNWLDFKIDDAGKIDLFVRGARAAGDFLRQQFV